MPITGGVSPTNPGASVDKQARAKKSYGGRGR